MKHSPQKTTVFYSYESSGNSGVQKTGCAIIQHTPYITREHALQAFESEIELPADCAEGTCSAYALLFDGTLYSVAWRQSANGKTNWSFSAVAEPLS